MHQYFSMIGGTEIIVILMIVLLLFGGKKLPELARSLGQGIREFKKASSDIGDELRKEKTVESETETPKAEAKETNKLNS